MRPDGPGTVLRDAPELGKWIGINHYCRSGGELRRSGRKRILSGCLNEDPLSMADIFEDD
jgi:hypothetical protein